jgi:hypothetical protein
MPQPHHDPRVDAYIARSADFARPILETLRAVVHAACPEIRETIKWGCPSFELTGMVFGMAAFKRHAKWGFWRGQELDLPKSLFTETSGDDPRWMKVTSIQELPSDRTLTRLVKQAAKLDAEVAAGLAPKTGTAASKAVGKKLVRTVKVPRDLKAKLAMKKHAAARKTFDAFPFSARRDYVEWLETAKRPETRDKRLATTLAWLAEGKRRNWKYENC